MIELNKDQKTYLKKEVKNSIHTLQYLLEMVNKEELSKDMAFTLFKNIEFSVVNFEKTLGLESSLKKEQEDRYLQLRMANIKIRDLENKIRDLATSKISPEYVSDLISDINNRIKEKFNILGLKGIIEINIKSEYKVLINYIPMFNSPSFSFSETPETDKENYKKFIKNMEKEGFKFGLNYLILNDKNIDLIEKKIETILKNVRFIELKNWNDEKEALIREIHFSISLSDLINSLKY